MKPIAVFLFLLLTSIIFAQEGKISGYILDGEFENEPLAFVTVTVKGTSTTVSTDLNGEYVLKIAPGTYTLVFDFVGYESKEMTYVVAERESSKKNKDVMYAKKLTISIASVN